jgi:hypothetical protein
MRGILPWILGAFLLGAPAAASAQTAAGTPPHRPRATRIYFGLWSTHLNADRLHIDTNNPMLGVTHGPIFATTFVNSFGRRAYAAGFQRDLWSRTGRVASASLGLRLGAISGYDERFLNFAKDTPVLPMLSVYSLLELKRVGVEVSWTMVVASAALSVRF